MQIMDPCFTVTDEDTVWSIGSDHDADEENHNAGNGSKNKDYSMKSLGTKLRHNTKHNHTKRIGEYVVSITILSYFSLRERIVTRMKKIKYKCERKRSNINMLGSCNMEQPTHLFFCTGSTRTGLYC